MKIKTWLKKEIIFEISFLLALASSVFLLASGKRPELINSIDWRVLAVLFSLMLVVAGFQQTGIFSAFAKIMCTKLKDLRRISLVLILLCFFSSMFITNDVALITFVPFTLMILSATGNFETAIVVIVLQTIGANLGSMLTPVGNPQNLFLFSKMNISLGNFVLILLPYTVFSLILLVLCTFFIPRRKISLDNSIFSIENQTEKQIPRTIKNYEKITDKNDKKTSLKKISGIIIFSLLFVLCILCVLNVLPYYFVLPLVFAVTVMYEPFLVKKADYMLLFTFCCFFIFTGNIQQIEPINFFLQNAIKNREFWIALASSQFISNVPATLLLYPFSSNYKDLLLGVDLGGLGTLVASLASLISFKLYSNYKTDGNPDEKNISGNLNVTQTKIKPAKFLGIFTIFNLIFLAFMIALYFLLKLI